MTETPQDILGDRIPAGVDRNPVDISQMQPALYDAGTRVSGVRSRRRRFDDNFESMKAEARNHLSALSRLLKTASDQINASDGMKAAIRNEAALGYAVFLPDEIVDLRAELNLIADTLAELEAWTRTDVVI